MNRDTSINATSAGATHFEDACVAAGIGVWELHVDEDRLVYSQLARSMFGFPPEGEVTRQMVHGTIHPEDLDGVLTAARRAMNPDLRTADHYLYRIRRYDTGELRWLKGHGLANFIGEGEKARPVLYAGSVLDTTEAELTRRALAASEEQLRLAVDAAKMALWDVDLQTGVVAHSPELNRMLGFAEDARPKLEELRPRYASGERERLEAEGAAAMARGETSLQSRVDYNVPGIGDVTYVLRAALATSGDKTFGRRVIGVLFDATDQVRNERRLETLNRELLHRLKNMAALASSFARQIWKGDPRLDSFFGRIRALTLSADLMFGASAADRRLRNLVMRSLDPFRNSERDPFEVNGQDLELTDKVFNGIALLLHELATNAIKHGALSVPEGQVSITWERSADQLTLQWLEIGGPPVSPPTRQGFGLQLISKMALPPPHSVELDFRRDGLVAIILVRLD